MAVKFKMDTKFIEQLKNSAVQTSIAQIVISQMKDFIAAGKSPVAGKGRFQGYKAAEAVKSLKQRRNKAQRELAIPAKKATSSSKTSILQSQLNIIKSKGYPYSVLDKFPGKKVRPVNLFLTGEMLSALTFKVGPNGPKIGIFDPNQSKKAETHNNGTQVPKVPQRKFMPNKKGDDLVVSIRRSVIDIYSKALNDIIKRANAK